MAVGPRLELRQRQSLVMTPQLQQAIKLLQMSNVELVDYITEELDRNPVLERDERPDQQAEWTDSQADKGTADTVGDGLTQDSAALANTDQLPSTEAAPLDTEMEHTFMDDSGSDAILPSDTGLAATDWSGSRGSGGSFEDPDLRLDQALSEEQTLREYLYEHMPLVLFDETDRLIGQQLIDAVDEYGYLGIQLINVATQVGVDEDEVEAVLEALQDIGPPGLLARDLRECLALQLKEQDRLDPFMEMFLDHLHLMAEGNLAEMAKVIGTDMEDILDMVSDIRQLNPKPGLAFGADDAQTLIPDVLVRRGPDGTWVVDLNTETLPKVLINKQYRATLSGLADKEKIFLTEAIQSANWLVRALDQRAQTILKVSTELVQQQSSFLTHGIRFLKPLTLKDIADVVEMHESTISRVTSNKYMATPRGVFELKYFFTTALPGAGGGIHSAESVRHRIRDLIDGEDPKKILSDDKLVDLLKTEGIEVARRTVAKYREGMNIPSSVQRRKEKRMAKVSQ